MVSNDHPQEQPLKQLPVIIAGGGPCGLTAALNFQQHGIPYCIIERASREKLCSNAGSGIDVAPSAVSVLESLQVDMDKAIQPYEYMYIADMKGKHIKTYDLHNMKFGGTTRNFGFANRSNLQNALLDKIMDGKTMEEQEAVLKCGITVTGYENAADHVKVMLSDGSNIKGAALLACDGIHSGVRKHMHRNVNDDLNYCGQECWWGKIVVEPESEISQELKSLNKSEGMGDGNVSLAFMGTPQSPGGFFSCEIDNTHAWVYFVKNKDPAQANQSNDLTRRGGCVLSEKDKQEELEKAIANCHPIMQSIIRSTPASDITKAGLFDRKNLDLPFVDGRVGLLGDAAHPQSPMQGQGANMAIVDGYVVSCLLAAAKMDNIGEALQSYDTQSRREGINKVIKEARSYGRIAATKSRWKIWAVTAFLKYAPNKTVMTEMVKSDKSNQEFMEAML
ncbi:MAG: hypothetical protein SGILL_001544 [Bacillariaceae sp.]